MPKAITPFLCLLLFAFYLDAQETTDFYKKNWAEVHRYELVERPKSALNVVDKIYDRAKAENNFAQSVKALMYQSKLALILEEDAQLKIVQKFKAEIAKNNPPESNVLESILADIYWQYFQQNRWQFYNRTNTAEKVEPGDFRTWDLQTLFVEVHQHFKNSLQNEKILQQTDISTIEPLLGKVKNSERYRPTLYDFIAHNALDFYRTDETRLAKPALTFKLNDEKYFGNLLELTIETPDSLSLQYHALKIYRSLLRFHRNDPDPSPYINARLEQLRFVAENSDLSNAEEIRKNALNDLQRVYRTHPSSTLIDFDLAHIHYNAGDKKQALDICNKAIARFQDSWGAEQCEQLKEEITRPHLQLQALQHVPINAPSRIRIDYANLDRLTFTVYQITEKQQTAFQELRGDSLRLAFISGLESASQWQNTLPDSEDFLQHSTEIVVPELVQGRYLIFAKPADKALEEDSLFAYALLQVTDLALLETNLSGTHRYQVVSRSTGKPIEGAQVHLTNKGSRYGNRISKKFTTDKDGFFSYTPNDNYSNIKAEVSFKKDRAVFGDYWINNYNHSNNREENYVTARAFLFTDRSIYRPGQTVYFKGILTRSEGGKTSILPAEYVEVYLENVNGEQVGYLRLQANEFGSFSGEFKLPATGLNGAYILYAEEDYEEDSEFYDNIMEEFHWSEIQISVEEYKRPKFEVSFEPIKETYQVKDTITVSGSADAYSGSNISNAKVVYRVHRKVQLPRWFYWSHSMPYHSEPQEITHGELTTDTEGNFTIDFRAIPDEDVSKDNQPIFEYEVTADITDLNGETRSASTIVRVGYHTMQTAMSLPAQLDRNRDYQITINTENLNGQFVPAEGIIRIYKMKAPERPQRDRIWPGPDQPILSEEEFKKLFPHEPYNSQSAGEQKGELVWEKNFNTGDSKTLNIKPSKSWNPGGYLVELQSEDRFGQEVKDKAQFRLFDPKSDAVADNQLFFWKTDKNTYKPGEEIKLTIGSASHDITVVIDVEKNHQIVATHLVHLSNESKELKIPVTEKDEDDFALQYTFVNYNSFNTGTRAITIEDVSNELTIETASFRDRLQPGMDETWSFEIKGADKKTEAELLASMYDASLDQFKPHIWTFNPIENSPYYTYGSSRGHQSFGTQHFIIRNLPYRHYSPSRLHFDRLNWFGFSLTNPQYANQQYLRRLAASYTSKVHSANDPDRKEGYIYGTVTDSESGEPIPGVTVQIQPTKSGTVTDMDGHYSIKADQGDELIFSFIGYETATTTVRKDNVINVELALDAQELSEVVVTGYAAEKKQSLTGVNAVMEVADEEVSLDMALEGKAAGVAIRGNASMANQSDVSLIVVDGKIVDALNVSQEEIASAEVLKGEQATAIYGAQAAGGVLVITTKEGQKKLDQELAAVKARTNLKETAFFFPHLTTDKNGKVSFTFTTPEALTRWKLQLLAHTKGLASQTKTLQTVTQKDLMVVPNAPRFLRQGDEIVFSAKISNLSPDSLSGVVALQLFDAVTGDAIDSLFGNQDRNQHFNVSAKNNTSVSWKLKIPEDVEAIQYKVVAKAGDFSDGEQNALPVLTNRTLVTETLPMNIRSGETKTFVLDKLKNVSSPTLKHHQLTLEVTSSPAWYAIQALPYLIEFPYECSEQTFARYYANLIGNHIVTSSPKIKAVFEQWESAGQLISNLEKNEELKSIIIQETPWLRDAQSETEQKKRLAALFDLSKMQEGLEASLNKLEQMQFNSGGFPWFAGSSNPNRYITQHIATGFGHLKSLGISNNEDAQKLVQDAVSYLDSELADDYDKLLDIANDSDSATRYLKQQHIAPIHVHYLYMRSFFPEFKLSNKAEKAKKYYEGQAAEYWTAFNLYSKGMLALSAHRASNEKLANTILTSLEETSIQSDELGMYWKSNRPSWWWYESPIETQALLIEVFSEILEDGVEKTKTVDELKIWLLKNKQTNQWSTTKATTEAVYALLLKGTDWLAIDEQLTVEVGNEKVTPPNTPEAGTGYYKTTWQGAEVKPEMAEVTLAKKEDGIAWGALYWQYFEDLDKITSAETPLKLSKKLFLVKNTDRGEVLSAIEDTTSLTLGNLVRVRIELRSDRAMEFVHMKDMRASGLEPVDVLSEYKWQDGLGYYQSTKDASTNFFFDLLPKGIYVFEYDLRVNNAGNFSNGITTIQCIYAPEFSSHSEGVRLEVK